jgi:hypothetical protein
MLTCIPFLVGLIGLFGITRMTYVSIQKYIIFYLMTIFGTLLTCRVKITIAHVVTLSMFIALIIFYQGNVEGLDNTANNTTVGNLVVTGNIDVSGNINGNGLNIKHHIWTDPRGNGNVGVAKTLNADSINANKHITSNGFIVGDIYHKLCGDYIHMESDTISDCGGDQGITWAPYQDPLNGIRGWATGGGYNTDLSHVHIKVKNQCNHNGGACL